MAEAQKEFGSWVQRCRKAYDWTQSDLAKRIGCATDTVKHIEQGRLKPSKQLAELLVRELAIPDIDRASFLMLARGANAPAEDISTGVGIVNLVYRNHSPVLAETSRGQLMEWGSIFVGEKLTVTFIIRNYELHPLRIRELVAGARGPGAHQKNWDCQEIPFPRVRDLVLNPDETYTYHHSRSFADAGDYFVEPLFLDVLGEWHGIQPFTRIKFFVIEPIAAV